MNDAAANNAQNRKSDFSDVMLTMDVVDTLRYRRQLVERELSADDSDQAMIEKVRKIYADQGLEVSDALIAEALAALREERFTYKPPRSGFNRTLANLYIQRGLWLKIIGAALVILICVILVYRFTVSGPAKRRQAQATEAVAQAWQQFQASNPAAQLAESGRRLYEDAQRNLKKGDTEAAGRQAATLGQLAQLPATLESLHSQAVAEAREARARQQADTFLEQGERALAAGDAAAADNSRQSLDDLLSQLQQAFTLRVVSRPDESSGFWRAPPNNPSGRNYYIVVEAIDTKGNMVKVPITSEEDGRTSLVSKWAMRVDRGVFEQFRRDKADDGIVQNNRFGEKRRGFLSFDYAVPTSGNAITEW
jgi:hypothetical protein